FNARTGRVAHEATYYISSDDYYDSENYASRLVNGELVIYTPLYLNGIDTREPMRWPLVRRWVRESSEDASVSRGRPLFQARDIYRPVAPTVEPVVHSVSVCPLGSTRPGDELDCTTRAFVGPPRREFFVSTSDIYLWVTPGWDDQR